MGMIIVTKFVISFVYIRKRLVAVTLGGNGTVANAL